MSHYQNPTPTVDIIIEIDGSIVWIRRKNEPLGWALPGGFVDLGESVEQAAIREAREETGLDVTLKELLYVYSSPHRDPRQHNLSVVFIAHAQGLPKAGDDAAQAQLFALHAPPKDLVFDHEEIFNHYLRFIKSGRRPSPVEYLTSHHLTIHD